MMECTQEARGSDSAFRGAYQPVLPDWGIQQFCAEDRLDTFFHVFVNLDESVALGT